MTTDRCQFCGGVIGDGAGTTESAVYMHVMSERHKQSMSPQERPTARVRRVYEEPDPYAEPPMPSETARMGPMRHLVGPAGVICQACREPVEVVSYLGGVRSVHPSGSLACPPASVAG